MKIHNSLLNAVDNHYGEKPLREICIHLMSEGITSSQLLDEFEEIRRTKSLDEEYEDVILDVMDALCGWCSSKNSLVQLSAA